MSIFSMFDKSPQTPQPDPAALKAFREKVANLKLRTRAIGLEYGYYLNPGETED